MKKFQQIFPFFFDCPDQRARVETGFNILVFRDEKDGNYSLVDVLIDLFSFAFPSKLLLLKLTKVLQSASLLFLY